MNVSYENNGPSEIILTNCMYAKCFIAWGGIATLTLATVSKIGHFLDNNATSHIKYNVLIGIVQHPLQKRYNCNFKSFKACFVHCSLLIYFSDLSISKA